MKHCERRDTSYPRVSNVTSRPSGESAGARKGGRGRGGGERERERKDAAPLRLVNNVSRDECFGSNRHKRTDVVHTCLPRRVLRYIYVRNVSARTEQDVRDTLALAGRFYKKTAEKHVRVDGDSTGTRVPPPALPSRFSVSRKGLTCVNTSDACTSGPGQIFLFLSLSFSLFRRPTRRLSRRARYFKATYTPLDCRGSTGRRGGPTTSAPLLVALTLVACALAPPAPRNLRRSTHFCIMYYALSPFYNCISVIVSGCSCKN